jgi:uncharacterized OB-fold protein
MTHGAPLPIPDEDTRPFWEGCGEHKLLFQKCLACSFVRWPPSIACPSCYSSDTEWITASGKGKIHTFVVYHKAFHPAFDGQTPYVVAVVQLAEGPMIATNIVGCDPSEMACDMPVEVVWEDVSDTVSLPKFRLEQKMVQESCV